MKYLIPPALSVIVSTVLCVWLSHAFHMPQRDLKTVAAVSFTVSAVAAFSAVALAARKQRRHSAGPTAASQ